MQFSMMLQIPMSKKAIRTFHPLMQFLKNDVFDDFIGCLIV